MIFWQICVFPPFAWVISYFSFAFSCYAMSYDYETFKRHVSALLGVFCFIIFDVQEVHIFPTCREQKDGIGRGMEGFSKMEIVNDT
jgi:hypothetical protein